MATILKSKIVIEKQVELLQSEVTKLKEKGINPNLKVILVGNHEPSVIYTSHKKKFCEKVGASCEIIKLSEDIAEEEFLKQIDNISSANDVHGCFVQLPLPKHLSHIDVGRLIPPNKDVDGFHPNNLYELLKGRNSGDFFVPCTPKGIITLLDYYDINVEGKKALVIGRSLIVGKPMQMLLTNLDATVTLAHSRTKNVKELSRQADIIVTAVGDPEFFKSDYLDTNRKDQILIDVGICKNKAGKLCGDMDYNNLVDKCGAISPVPGGVGPMTILSLIENLIQSAKQGS